MHSRRGGPRPGAACAQSSTPVARTSTSLARPSAVDEALQLLAAARVPQLAERLRLDLTDALARHLEVLTDLFEGVVALFPDAEPHAEDLLFARRQRLQHLPRLLGEVHVDDRLGGGDD